MGQAAQGRQSQSDIGATIRRHRLASNLTLQAVADELNVTHQAVSLWEQGATSPRYPHLRALAELLGVTVGELLNEEAA